MATARNKHYFLSEENKHLQNKKLDRLEFFVKTNKYVNYRQREIKMEMSAPNWIIQFCEHDDCNF